LPPGRLIDSTDDGPWPEPLLWYSGQQAAPGSWRSLGGPAGRAGLLPVLVALGGAEGRPEDWELMPGEPSYPGDHDAAEVLEEYWRECAADGDGAWPGLAPGARLTCDPDVRAAEVADMLSGEGRAWFEEPHLALVPARRSADIPAAVGWSGPMNHENDVARLCSVLRSWEERFGVRVTGLGFSTLVVSVAAPPADETEAEAIAAEHLAFCPDNITQGSGSITAYAKELIGEHAWSFWWD
jgi:hypothetical protein